MNEEYLKELYDYIDGEKSGIDYKSFIEDMSSNKEYNKQIYDFIGGVDAGIDYKDFSADTLKKNDGLESPSEDGSLDSASVEKPKSDNLVGYWYNKILKESARTASLVGSTGIDIMSNLFGAENVMGPEVYKDLKDKGLSDSEVKDYAKKYAKKELLPGVRTGLVETVGVDQSEEYVAKKDAQFLPSAIGGVLGSIPAMMGGPVQRVIQFGAQAMDGVNEEMEGNPLFKDVTENEKYIISTPIAVVNAVLERLGLQNVLKGSVNSITLEVIKSVGKKKVGKETLESLVEQTVKNYGKRVLSSTEGEFITGASQQAAELGIKNIYDLAKDNEMFDATDGVLDTFGQILYAGAAEAVGGGIFGSISAAGKGKLTKDTYELAAAEIDNKSAILTRKKDIEKAYDVGEITENERDVNLKNVDDLVSSIREVKDLDITSDQKIEVMKLLDEKKKLESNIKGKDKSLTTKLQEELGNVNEKIKAVINSEQAPEETLVIEEEVAVEEDLKIDENEIIELEKDIEDSEAEGTIEENLGEMVYLEDGTQAMLQIDPDNINTYVLITENQIIEVGSKQDNVGNNSIASIGVSKFPSEKIKTEPIKDGQLTAVSLDGVEYEIIGRRRDKKGESVVKVKEKSTGLIRRFKGEKAERILKDVSLQETPKQTPLNLTTEGKAVVAKKKKTEVDNYTEQQLKEELDRVEKEAKDFERSLEETIETEEAMDKKLMFPTKKGDVSVTKNNDGTYKVSKKSPTGRYVALVEKSERENAIKEYERLRNQRGDNRLSDAIDLSNQFKKEQDDKVLSWLDGLIEATETKGRAYDATLGLPLFMFNQGLKLVRASYKSGKTLKQAIEDSIKFIKNQGYSLNEIEYKKEIINSLKGKNTEVTQTVDAAIESKITDIYTTQEIDRVKALSIEKEDGATMNLNGSKYEKGGLVIALASKNMPTNELTQEVIQAFIDENKEAIQFDNVKVGIYKFPNRDEVSVDINIVADRSLRAEALSIGKELGQESLYDLDSFENIKTGADGKNPKKLTTQEFIDIQKRLSNKKVVSTTPPSGTPPSGTPPSGTPPIITSTDIRERSDKAVADKIKNKTIKERLRLIREKLLDRQTRIKDLLNGIGSKAASKALNLMITKAGAKGYANFRFKKARKDIFLRSMGRKMSVTDTNNLNEIIYAIRIIAINKNRAKQGLKGYVGIDGYNEASAQRDLDAFKAKLGDKKFNDLTGRATEYFKVYSENLKRMKDVGIISEEVYLQLKDVEYSPIKTVKYLLPENADAAELDRFAKISGMNSTDIKKLSDENVNEIVMDAEWLLMIATSMTEARVFENRLLNSFSDAYDSATQEQKDGMSEHIKDNPLLKDSGFKDGRPKYKYDKVKVPVGFRKVSYKKDGQKKDMIISDKYADQLLDIKLNTNNTVPALTGVNVLRFFATSGNPLFIVGNTAVDFANILFLSDVYSKNKFTGALMLSADFIKTSLSKVLGTKQYNKIYEEYVEHGGSLDYLSADGIKAVKGIKIKNEIADGALNILRGYGHAMAYLGETSEISFRLAVYQKSKENQLKEFEKINKRQPTKTEMEDLMFEASREARETIDFSQGGSFVKSADRWLPYLNAATQGLRKATDYASKNPGGFASSMAQGMIMSGSLASLSMFLLLRSMGEEEDVIEVLNSISDYEKANYHVVFTGGKDKDGEYNYWRFKKLPTISFAATFAEQTAIKAILKNRGIDYDLSGEVLTKTLKNIAPIDLEFKALLSRNPLAAAITTYTFNYDSFYDQQVFKGPTGKKIAPEAEGMFDDKVDLFYKQLAPMIGMSPKRSKAALEKIITSETTNPMIGILYSGWDKVFKDDSTQVGAEVSSVFDKLGKNSARKLFRSTNKNLIAYKEKDISDIFETEEETKQYLSEQKIYEQVRKRYKEEGGSYTKEEYSDLIKENFNKIDQLKYYKKYLAYINNMDADRSILDIVFEDTPSVQAYMLFKKFGDSLDQDEIKEIKNVYRASRRKISTKGIYIYRTTYQKKAPK
jgi:hypothetical protein